MKMRLELERRKENRNWETGGDVEKLDEQLRGRGEAGAEGVQTQLLRGFWHWGKSELPGQSTE